MSRQLGHAAWSLMLCAACASAPAAPGLVGVERKDWVTSWDRQEARKTRIADQDITVIGPAKGALRRVRLRQDVEAEEKTAPGPKAFAVIGRMSQSLDPTTPLILRCGAVEDRLIDGEPFVAIVHQAKHARVYWTVAHNRVRSEQGVQTRDQCSTLYFEGVDAGSDRLVLRSAHGDPDLVLEIQVECPPAEN